MEPPPAAAANHAGNEAPTKSSSPPAAQHPDEHHDERSRGSNRQQRLRSTSRSRSRSRDSHQGSSRRRRSRSWSRGRSSRGDDGSRSRSRRRSRSSSRSRHRRHRSRGLSPFEEPKEESEPLPVFHYKEELMAAVKAHKVVVCKGETGSGKTTQFPQYLCDAFDPPGLVGVTQPRRVAAVSVATRVAEERRCRVGEEVGYQIRFEDRTTPGRTRIKFMTDGVLVRECLEDPTLRRYSFVMLDEAHERSVNTDILFGLMKRALAVRDDLRVVVTSATLDVLKFSQYFDGCPVKEIPVRTHPVSVYHSKTKFIMTRTGPSSSSYIQSLVDIALKIHRTQAEGHILAFLTGQDEIEKACVMLRRAVEEDRLKGVSNQSEMELRVLPLYGMLTAEQQIQVFRPVPPHVRKCIVATNIAETSVTVPGVRFVIDPGFVKQKTYNPEKRMESLVIVPISQVAAEQRAGRAGRTGPGQCYRLYSRECLEEMMPETVPEIQRCNLANVVLYLKVLGVGDVLGFDYFEAPSEEQLGEALLMLHSLGALDGAGKVTELGQAMCKFPLDPALSRAILQAHEEECLKEVVTIAAMLSVESIWFSRRKEKGDRDEEAERAHAVFRHPRGDHITYLMVYAAWEERGFSEQWLKDAFLSVRALKNARSVRHQLEQEVRKAIPGVTASLSSAKDLEAICRAVTAGFFNNAAARCGAGGADSTVYKHMEGLMPNEELKLVYIHPASVLASGGAAPQFVVYHELVYTARPFMRHVLGVERGWLMDCRRRIRTASLRELSGGVLQKEKGLEEAAGAAKWDEQGAANAGTAAAGAAVAPPPKDRTSQEALEAARRRFLERKQQQQQQQQQKRR